jgi:predicted nuclease with TOPRIM domain
MQPKSPQVRPERHELEEKRRALHGQRRRLHDRLSEVCEEFVLENLNRKYKQSTLVRELQYLLDFYRDDENWEGIE